MGGWKEDVGFVSEACNGRWNGLFGMLYCLFCRPLELFGWKIFLAG